MKNKKLRIKNYKTWASIFKRQTPNAREVTTTSFFATITWFTNFVLLIVALYILAQQEQDPKTCVREFMAKNERMFFISARHVIIDFVMSSIMGWDSELLALCLSLFACCYYSHWRQFRWAHLKSFFLQMFPFCPLQNTMEITFRIPDKYSHLICQNL